MIDRSTIDRIFAAADIAEVVGDFITLRKSGANFTACCPFHSEKTPSFIVSPAKGLYKCFGCGKGGGSVNFVMEHEKLTYPEALRWLARKYNIEIQEKAQTEEEVERNNDRESMLVLNSWGASFFQNEMNSTQEGRAIGLAYFHERGFNEQTIKTFALGYCPETGARDTMSRTAIKEGYQEKFLEKTGLTIIREDGSHYDRFAGRVMFPIHSISGRVIGFGGRTMRTDKKVAKYLNSPQSEIYDKSHTLYGIFQAKKSITTLGKCILVEGYTDVMQMHQSGIQNVVASSGTSLTVEQVRLIKRFTRNVTVIYDGDMAGIKASMRGIDIILAEGLTVRVVPLPQGDDPDSFARARNSTELVRYIEEHEEDFLSFKTRTLLHEQSDPIARAELINEIIRSVAVIPDPIAREVYIGECSRLMDISPDVLSRSVASVMVRLQMARPAARRDDTQSSPQGSPQNPSQNSSQDPSSDPTIVANRQPYEPLPGAGALSKESRLKELDCLEVELAGYLIKYGTESFSYEIAPENVVELGVTDLIVSELSSDNIEMTDPVCNIIFAEAKKAWQDEGRFLDVKHYTEHENAAVMSFAADVIMRDEIYTASTMWQRYEIKVTTERERLSQAVPKAIVIYKTKVIGAQIAALKSRMSVDLESIDPDLVDQIKAFNQSKAAMNDRYKRLL